jgi:Flp pilus assembly pilin Flp
VTQVMLTIKQLRTREDGQDLIEYGLLAALIAVVAVVGITTLGNTILNTFWQDIAQLV